MGLMFVFVLSFLALRTTCHPRPTTRSLATTVELAQDSFDVGVPSVPDFTTVERAAGTSVRRHSPPGFHHFLEMGSGWNMYYSSWSSIALPVPPAAWALTHLYASMLAQARGVWANQPPQHTLDFVFGGIRMVMHCPQQPIPWGFVGNFAERLLQITSGGWTGLYKIMLSHAESQVNFVVLLSVVPPVGQ